MGDADASESSGDFDVVRQPPSKKMRGPYKATPLLTHGYGIALLLVNVFFASGG